MVEEKNRLITLYIENKVKELENMSMFVSKDNVQKVINNFLNRNEDIEIIKTKIDTIFNNSISAYKENLEKMGYTYDEIMKVYDKVVKLNKTRAKLYLMGGIVPYVLLNDRTGRRHESFDLLCDKKDVEQLRELFRKEDLYDPKRDSLTYTVNNIDYGFQVIVDKIKVKANQFGLEAQPPAILAMINGIKNFNGENLIKGFSRKEELFKLLSKNFNAFSETPTGVMISSHDLASEVKVSHNLSDNDLAFIFAFILLKDHGIITIPPVSMPGASTTIRFDLSTKDAFNLDLNDLNKKIESSFNKLQEVVTNEDKCREIVFTS